MTRDTNRPTQYNRVYMRQYRKSEAGIRAKRINTITQNRALQWMRTNHPDVYKQIKQQATEEIDGLEYTTDPGIPE